MQRIVDIKTPVQLYRHLCRRVRELPIPVQDYYKHYIRQVLHCIQFYCVHAQLPSTELAIHITGQIFKSVLFSDNLKEHC